MKNQLAALALLPALIACAPAYAACQQKSEPAPAQLEKIIVTPSGSYTESQWAERRASKKMLASVVTLPAMVVTPDYTITDEERRQFAHEQAHAVANNMQASAAPGSNRQPSLIRFLRRLFN